MFTEGKLEVEVGYCFRSAVRGRVWTGGFISEGLILSMIGALSFSDCEALPFSCYFSFLTCTLPLNLSALSTLPSLPTCNSFLSN